MKYFILSNITLFAVEKIITETLSYQDGYRIDAVRFYSVAIVFFKHYFFESMFLILFGFLFILYLAEELLLFLLRKAETISSDMEENTLLKVFPFIIFALNILEVKEFEFLYFSLFFFNELHCIFR